MKNMRIFNKIMSVVLAMVMVLSMLPMSVLATQTDVDVGRSTTAVAKVGNTEYATIDEAVVNWTNGSTLTLLADVTLSDVITLKSTEHHILNLGTYTMTAASGKHAILITANGVGTAAKSCLTINADSENPGGITATGKACIYYNNANKIADRLMVTINGGVFNGSYAVNSTSGPLNAFGMCTSPLRGQGAPYYVINGGTFDAQVYLNAAMLKVTGGTFNKNLTCMGDSTAHRVISGGTFSGMTMTADADGKFTIGSGKNQTDVGLYVDDNGYLVVGGPVITEAGEQFEASSANYSGWSSYLKYSSAATNNLYYTSVEEALADNNKASGSVTVYVDELDMTGINYKGTIVVPEGESVKIVVAEGTAPAWSISEGAAVTYVDADGNDMVMGEDGTFESAAPAVTYVAEVNDVKYATLEEAFKAATSGCEIDILADVTVDYKWDSRYTGAKFTVPVTIDGNGHTLTFTNVVNDGFNQYSVFRFETDATVKNLTVDMKDAVSEFSGRFRAISAMGNLTVDNCTFIGNGSANNTRAIIFGEGVGADLSNVAIAITNSTFQGWRRGISDNENGKDVKTVTVTGNKLEDASVYVSAYETVTFTGNTVEEGYVDLRSYTTDNALNVTATGNTLTANTESNENFIKAGGIIDAQTDFVIYVKPVAKVNGVGYATFADALTAAKTMTGDVTVEILDKVILNGPVGGSFESITFVGKDTDAEIYIDLQGVIYMTGKTVAFKDLILSKVAGGHIADAGFMNLAFGVYNADEVTYTNCTFTNGAYASYGVNTFTDCTFYRSHDRYGLWAYGAEEVIVDGCTFADIRGIKVYDEGKQCLTGLTVTNTDFSAVTDKPAIVLTSGKSVTLSGNTYNPAKGVFELDLDGNPDGTSVTSTDVVTCVNDNGACGVLVDGKIYTTVAQAKEVAVAGSNVTLLHDSAETVEFVVGVNLDKNGFAAANVTVAQPAPVHVAMIGTQGYENLAAAVAAAQAGDEIVLLADVAENVTTPNGITLNGNGFTINGTVTAGGDLTFAGATTITSFSAGYYNHTITIGEGASLKVTGGRVTVSYGNTFNIIGSVSDAKTADKSTITPSLDLVAGISFNGDGGNVQFNVTNAYVKLGDSSTKNSGATGTFHVNATNSIVDFTKTLKVYMPTVAGKDPVFNATFKDSVVNFASHLELWLNKTTMTVDNTDLTVAGSFANAGTLNVTNGSNFVVKAPIMSSHGGNTGTINVTGGTFELKDSNENWVNEGTVAVAMPGKLIVNDFDCGTAGQITIDTTNMKAGDSVKDYIVVNKDTDVAYTDVVTVGNSKLTVDENGVLCGPAGVAQVGETLYATLTEAFAAVTSDNDTVTILCDVTEKLDTALRGNITTENEAKVTITLENTDWVYLPYTFVLGEGITLNVPNGGLFYYAGGAQINGTVITNAYYQMYRGTKLTINEPGSLTVTSETFILRYTEGDSNAGIYVVGDNNDETVGLNASVIYFYQGMIHAKDANIKTAVYWQTNETDGQGSANLVLDNSKMKVTVNEQNFVATGNATVTLTNGSVLTCAGGFVAAEGVVSVKDTSVIYYNGGSITAGLSGKGTEADPFVIASLNDLILFRDSVNAGETKYNAPGVYVALGADIDMADVDWSVNIGDDCSATFDGIFDGKGHTIRNLTATETAAKADGYVCAGLFGAIYGTAQIKNLTLENVTINTGDFEGNNVAAVVGFAYSCTGSVENVKVTGDIKIDAANVTGTGAIVGYDYYGKLTVKDCSVKGNDGSYIKGAAYVGGVIGYASTNSTVSGCTVENVDIIATSCAAGGIAGIMLKGGTVSECTVKNVDLTSAHANWKNAAAVAVGTITSEITVTNVTFEGVTANGEATSALVGSEHADKPSEPVGKVEAVIGNEYYANLKDAIAAAQDGDTITVIADIADMEVSVSKNVTITGDVTLNNVSINAVEGCTALTVSGLSFTGNSWINSGAADKLTVSGVTANVTPKNTSYTNSRSAFISLGRSEQKTLELTVENSSIVANGGADPILGWATITKADIIGNTFGAADAYQANSDSAKFMAIADGAVFNVKNNTVYSNYNGFVFGQNTTRGNAYAVNLSGNTFLGGADHVWLEVSGSTTCNATVVADNTNTVNGNAFTANDIKLHPNLNTFTGYLGVGVQTDESGKLTGGSFTMEPAADLIAEGYETVKNADGTYGIVEEAAPEVTMTLNGLNLRLQDLIRLGFYFNVETEETLSKVGALMWTAEEYAAETNFTVSSTVADNVTAAAASSANRYIAESEGIYAQYLDTEYYIIPYVQLESGEYVYGTANSSSALVYASIVYNGDYSDDEKSIVIDLLNYATAARAYFCLTEGLSVPEEAFNSIVSESDRAINWSDSLKAGYPAVNETQGVYQPTIKGLNTNLKEAINLNFLFEEAVAGIGYWTEEEYAALSTHDFSNMAHQATMTYGPEFCWGTVENLYSFHIYSNFYAMAYDEDENCSRTYGASVASYLTTTIETLDASVEENAAMIELAKAMLVYGNNALNNPTVNKGTN